MKHLRKFNENSHDWRANAFHGAPDEDKIIGQDADNLSNQIVSDYHGSKSHTSYLNDIEKTEADLRSAGLPEEEPVEEVEVEEVEKEKPNVVSRIKNFLGFGK